MNYIMLFASEAEAGAETEDMQAWYAYFEALGAAGVLRGGEQLMPASTASSVRVRDGVATVEDGPYADTRERLGGYALIEVDDLDAALDWARKCPGALDGTVEVRPVVTHDRG